MSAFEIAGANFLLPLKRLRSIIAKAVDKLGWVMVRKKTVFGPFTAEYSRLNLSWNIPSRGRGIGGWVTFSNASRGYHGILLQWFEYYHTSGRVLLIAESKETSAHFQNRYPMFTWVALDFFTEINDGMPDYVADICKGIPESLTGSFDCVFCQATLEHVYDPMAALRNLAALLSEGGTLLLHTHTPPFMYHPYPRDYFRFNIDWFEDVQQHIPQLALVELIARDGHVCCAFAREKIKAPIRTVPIERLVQKDV